LHKRLICSRMCLLGQQPRRRVSCNKRFLQWFLYAFKPAYVRYIVCRIRHLQVRHLTVQLGRIVIDGVCKRLHYSFQSSVSGFRACVYC
jgi:hypothetical protein